MVATNAYATSSVNGSGACRSVSAVIADLETAAGSGGVQAHAVYATRFWPLDSVLEGGARAGDLVLIGGTPGVGKTIFGMQWARNLARAGHRVVYACYEHDDQTLLGRLLLMESGHEGVQSSPDLIGDARAGINKVVTGTAGLADVLRVNPVLDEARRRVSSYSDGMSFLKGSGASTGVSELGEAMAEFGGHGSVLFVDYLQKVSVRPEPLDEAEKVTRVAEALKELALRQNVLVVAIVAADREGLHARRVRPHHLRGSSALAYESDVLVVLNDKSRIVARAHLTYDPVRAESYKDYVVMTVEKNRRGVAPVDMEFRKDFAHYRFDTNGSHVAERLIDERIDTEAT